MEKSIANKLSSWLSHTFTHFIDTMRLRHPGLFDQVTQGLIHCSTNTIYEHDGPRRCPSPDLILSVSLIWLLCWKNAPWQLEIVLRRYWVYSQNSYTTRTPWTALTTWLWESWLGWSLLWCSLELRQSCRDTGLAILCPGKLGAHSLAPFQTVDKDWTSARDHDFGNEYQNGKPF